MIQLFFEAGILGNFQGQFFNRSGVSVPKAGQRRRELHLSFHFDIR
jgi:hypothetical protein